MDKTTLRIIESGPWWFDLNEEQKWVALRAFGTRVMNFERWGLSNATPTFCPFGDVWPGGVDQKAVQFALGKKGCSQKINHPVAQAIEEVPAMMLALELIAAGLARIEPATREFCFDGLHFGMSSPTNWTRIINCIGWKNAVAALKSHANVA